MYCAQPVLTLSWEWKAKVQTGTSESLSLRPTVVAEVSLVGI